MFDILDALAPYNGMIWESGESFRDSILMVVKEHVKELPCDFHVADLVDLIRKKDWLRVTKDGLPILLLN